MESPGEPQLPKKVIQLIIPPKKQIERVIIKSKVDEILAGKYQIYPAQPPQILSKNESEIEFVKPSQSYSSRSLYPEEIVKIGKRGYLSGYNLASLIISPIQYNPVEKRLIVYSKVEFEITYKDCSDESVKFSKRELLTENLVENTISKIVINPQDIERFTPETQRTSSRLPEEIHSYLIITSENLLPDFQPLSTWKKKKGFSAKIVSISWIYEEYEGVDEAEKMRNFIIDAYANWGTNWVLLGGDTNVLPSRKAFAFDCEFGSFDDNFIPCDLYFSDLDGNWNADGDDIYGEVEDNIDMYPDVQVGRIPVENHS